MKDFSKIFKNYIGLEYTNDNLDDIIKIHRLMENNGIKVSDSTKSKLDRYSDNRMFRLDYFISRNGKSITWCPTKSPVKKTKIEFKPASWWFSHLLSVSEPITTMPRNWLDEQAKSLKPTNTWSGMTHAEVTPPPEEENIVFPSVTSGTSIFYVDPTTSIDSVITSTVTLPGSGDSPFSVTLNREPSASSGWIAWEGRSEKEEDENLPF